MTGSILIVFSLVVLFIAYLSYGRYIARKFELNNDVETPAHRLRDGVDYVPAKAPVVLGHHFASIAGAAPIIGPITAAVFGWIPVFLWLILGGIFIGSVHDFTALVISIRNDGKSIGEVIKKHVGSKGSILFLLFTCATLALVIAAFTIIVAKTFASVPQAASSSLLFIALAILFGLAINKLKLPLGISTVFGVILLLIMIYFGDKYPVHLSQNTWIYMLLAYIYIASVAPVWVLLQPRDYLNSFLLYLLLVSGFIGILFLNPHVQFPAFTAFKADKLGYLFPMLFVTVACGAISGFHALVASGTTAKQLSKETDAQPVAYGGMLIETFLGVLALITAVMLSKADFGTLLATKGPVGVFAAGMAQAIAKIPYLHLGKEFLVGFVSLVVSAFALTTLDTATRLGRFAFQELVEFVPGEKIKIFRNKHIATVCIIVPSAALIFSGQWKLIWPMFGSANQLLASISLLAATVWYFHKYKKKPLFITVPMFGMFAVTFFALINLIVSNMQKSHYMLSGMSIVLLLLAIFLAIEAYKVLTRKTEDIS